MRKMLPHSVRPAAVLVSLLVIVAATLTLSFALEQGDDARADSPAGPINLLAVDVESSGNTATGLDAIDECIVIDPAPGTTATIDVVVDSVPPAGGISGFQFALNYDPAILRVIAVDNSLLLAANGITLFDFTDPLPDDDGKTLVAAADFSDTEPEAGAGVLSRLTLEVIDGASPGITDLTLTEVLVFDGPGGNEYAINDIRGGRLSLGTPCTLVTPTPIAPPTPSPSPTPEPGSISGLVVASGTVQPGQDVAIPITADAERLGYFQLEIEYDPTLVRAEACHAAGVCVLNAGPDRVRLTGFFANGASGDDIFLGSITFAALPQAQGISPLILDTETLELADTGGRPLIVTPTNGEINVSGPTLTPSPTPLPPMVNDLRVGSAVAAPGDFVTVPVLATLQSIGAYRIDVRYDTTKLQADSCHSFSGICSMDAISPGVVRLNGATLSPLNGTDLVLGTITFFVKGGAQGTASLLIDEDTLLLGDVEGNRLTATAEDGEIEIVGPTLTPTPTPGPEPSSVTPTPGPGEPSPTPTPVPPAPGFAAVRISSAVVESNQQVTITVTADVSDLGSYRFDVLFDETLIQPIYCDSTNGVCSIGAIASNVVRINGSNLAGITGYGKVLGTVTFVAGLTEGVSALTIDPSTLVLADTVGDPISGSIENGQIVINAFTPTPPGFTFSPPPPTPGPTVTSTAIPTPTATATMTPTATPGPTSVPTATPTQTVSPGPSFTPGSSPEVPPLHVTIGEVDATLTKRRVLVITGEVDCSEPATVTIVGHVEQRRGKKSIGGVFVAHGVQCDGPTDWEARVFGGGRRFKEGLADLRLAVLAFGDGQVVSESQDLTVEIEKEKAKGKGNGSVAHWFGAVWR